MIHGAKQDFATDNRHGQISRRIKPCFWRDEVNRRIHHDDGRGVGEPLNEDIVVRGKYWMFFDGIAHSLSCTDFNAERLQNLVATFFSDAVIPSHSENKMLGDIELPQNIHLVTVQKLHQDLILLRLGHLFAEGESCLAAPVTVDLTATFGIIMLVEELSLSANQPLQSVHRLSWNDTPRNPVSSVENSVVRNLYDGDSNEEPITWSVSASARQRS